MLDVQRVETKISVRETYWAGDPDIDLSQSDLEAWYKTGDGLTVAPMGNPNVIRWRPLDEIEIQEITSRYVTASMSPTDMTREMCRYGLVAIGDFALRREAATGLSRLTHAAILDFEMIGKAYPLTIEGKGRISPIIWLGGMISEATFSGSTD